MWRSLARLLLAPPKGTTTRPLVEAVKERGLALEDLLIPQSDALSGIWTSTVATRVGLCTFWKEETTLCAFNENLMPAILFS